MSRILRFTLSVLMIFTLSFAQPAWYFAHANPPAGDSSSKAKVVGPVGMFGTLSQKTLNQIVQMFLNRAYVTSIGMMGFMMGGLPLEGLWPKRLKEKYGKTKPEPWMISLESSDFYVAEFEERALGVSAIYEKINQLPDSYFEPVGDKIVKTAKHLKFFPVLDGGNPMRDKHFGGGVGQGVRRPDLTNDLQEWSSYKFVSKDVIRAALKSLVLGESYNFMPLDSTRLVDIVLSQILIAPTSSEYTVTRVLRDFLAENMGDDYRARWTSFVEMSEKEGIRPEKYYRIEPLFHIVALMELIAKNHANPNEHVSQTEELFGSLAWLGRAWIANLSGAITRTLNPTAQTQIDTEEFISGRPQRLNKTETIILAKLFNISLLTASNKENRKELNQVMLTVSRSIESAISNLVENLFDIAKLETPKLMQRFFFFSIISFSVGSFLYIFPPGNMILESLVNGYDLNETFRIMGGMGIFFNIWVYISSGFEALTQPWNHLDVITTSATYGAVGAMVLWLLDLGKAWQRIVVKWSTIHATSEVEFFTDITKAGFKSGICQMGFSKLHSIK